MENRFLHDFMRRQATLITSGIPEETPTKKEKKPKFGTRDGKHPFGGDDMEARLATIVKERPAKKEVLQYFRDRIAECMAENF
jgi:hypothetical protein